jgi:hypothetical protein
LSMAAIDQQIDGGSTGSAQTTATDSFVASVPAVHAMSRSRSAKVVSVSRSTCGRWCAARRAPSSSTWIRPPDGHRHGIGALSPELHQRSRRVHVQRQRPGLERRTQLLRSGPIASVAQEQ